MKDTITLTMIVKNEAENLTDCLDSVRDQVDEIVIVDTGSSDGTPAVAGRYTDKIYQYPWSGDFSAARNFAVDQAGGEWILYLDADETLVSGSGSLKSLLARDERPQAYLLPLDNPTSADTGECNRFLVLRLFRNNGRYRFRGKIHEQVMVPENGVVDIADGPVISHKLLSARERRRKRGRNLALLKQACSAEPQNHFLHYYTGVEWLMLGKSALALPLFQQAYHSLTDEHLHFRCPALRYLVICLKDLGRLDDAIHLCREASLRYPEFTDLYYLGGVLYEQKREYQEAVKWLGRAIVCGTPPPLYSHMNGAGSFLAHYHLGYCHEMLGRRDAAESHYRQALDANLQYIYPVYNLFPLLLAKHGPRCTLGYLREKGYLADAGLAIAVAGQFFAAGYPDLAGRTLEDCEAKWEREEEYHFYLGQYSIYAGRPRQGLEYLHLVTAGSSFFVQAQVHRAVALLLLGRFPEARALALDLWMNHAARCHALVILKSIRLMEKGGAVNCPAKVREMDLPGVALEILDRCSRYLPGGGRGGRGNPYLPGLTGSLETIIMSTSPKTCLSLLAYHRERAVGLQSFLEYKYGPVVRQS